MKTTKYWLIGGLILFSVMTITIMSPAAITQIIGVAVAQTGTLWNNIRDANVGDGLTKGIAAFQPYGFNGTNFDRIRGDTVNGLDVDVTRTPGGAFTPADGTTNPTGISGTESFTMVWNGTTWDRRKTADALTGGTTPVGVAASACVFRVPTTAALQLCKGVASTLTVSNTGNSQIANGIVTTRSVSAANAAVTITVTGAANERTHVNGFDAYCSAGTAQIIIQTSTGPTTIWDTPAGAVGTALFSKEFAGASITSPNTGDNLTVQLTACGAGNTGTLEVRGGRAV